jgi:hypothetical protein
MLDEFTDIKYTMVILRLKELLEVEKQMIITAVNETDSKCCSIANNVVALLHPKQEKLFEHDKKTGEKYYIKNFQN